MAVMTRAYIPSINQSVMCLYFTRAWGRLGLAGSTVTMRRAGLNDEIHVFHRHGAEQHFVAEHQRADVAEALLERHFERPHGPT